MTNTGTIKTTTQSRAVQIEAGLKAAHQVRAEAIAAGSTKVFAGIKAAIQNVLTGHQPQYS